MMMEVGHTLHHSSVFRTPWPCSDAKFRSGLAEVGAHAEAGMVQFQVAVMMNNEVYKDSSSQGPRVQERIGQCYLKLKCA